MMEVKKSKWRPINTALAVLKGFRRLSTTFGPMRVIPEMVRMNENDEIKVWVNKNPASIEPFERANSEEQMLADIARIIVKYDA